MCYQTGASPGTSDFPRSCLEWQEREREGASPLSLLTSEVACPPCSLLCGCLGTLLQAKGQEEPANRRGSGQDPENLWWTGKWRLPQHP